jgi:cell wall-associated NlpC family hydrolase
MYDPRLTPARPDLAARRLEGVVKADRYVQPVVMQASASVAALRRAPEPDAEQLDQLIFGEIFDVLEERDGWAWGQARRDGYVGYLLAEALSAPVLTPTHTVAAVRSYAFAEPDHRSAAVALYSHNALLTIEETRDGFARAARAGWFPERHLRPVTEAAGDSPTALAERLLHAPYLWGGRESLGLDCSALVQQALYAGGRACPRDADQQQLELGHDTPSDQLARGDLVFWAGHVGWMVDGERLLHANGRDMAVSVEPLGEVVQRSLDEGRGPPTAYRRLG